MLEHLRKMALAAHGEDEEALLWAVEYIAHLQEALKWEACHHQALAASHKLWGVLFPAEGRARPP